MANDAIKRLQRGVRFFVLRADVLALALYLLGVAAVFAYPKLAREVYVDENAFLLGSTREKFDKSDGEIAQSYAHALEVLGVSSTRKEMTLKRLDWITTKLDASGFESYSSTFNSTSARLGDSGGMTRERVNMHAIARATRGSGRESIALVTPMGKLAADAEAATLGLALRTFETIGRAPWLAKDLIWVCVDAEVDDIESMMAWLKTYHSSGNGLGGNAAFERAGTIQQAFVFSALHGAATSMIRADLQGWNGAFPNQDIFTMFKYVARSANGMPVTIDDDEQQG